MKSVKFTLLLLLGINYLTLLSQDTLYVKPGPDQGMDAIVTSYDPFGNYGEHPSFFAQSWTVGGTWMVVRSLLYFDLDEIPGNATILSAKLSLYSYNSSGNGSHSTLDGSNLSYLERVTEPWDEYLVTWDNQPLTSPFNRVTLPMTTSSIQHYENIDVTALVQDMVDTTLESYGFKIVLETEQDYRRMLFASSDNTNSSYWPELEVIYGITQDILSVEDETDVKLYPNPVNDKLHVRCGGFEQSVIEVYNGLGQKVAEHALSNDQAVSTDEWGPSGVYIIRVMDKDGVPFQVKKVLKE